MWSHGEQRYRSDEIEAVRAVVSWYVGQILHGCGSPDCTETLCATGVRNVSSRPTRQYTPRSARAIAVTLASSSSPGERLCPLYRHRYFNEDIEHASKAGEMAEGPRDPLSMVQQLHDTAAVRHLCRPTEQHDDLVQDLHDEAKEQVVNERIIREVHDAINTLEALETAPSRPQTVELLSKGLRLLISCLSVNNEPPWSLFLCDLLVKHGNAAITRKIPNPGGQWARILDTMSLEPYTRLLLRIVHFIVDCSTSADDCHGRDDTSTLLSDICEHLVERASELHAASLEVSYLCIWLKNTFIARWRGTPKLRGPEVDCLTLLTCIAKTLSYAWPKTDSTSLSLLPVVASLLDAPKLAETWIEAEFDLSSVHILKFHCIFTPTQLMMYFRTINHLKMQRAHSAANIAVAVRERSEPWVEELTPVGQLKWLEEHYLLLSVRRGNVLHDAFNQLWERRKGELLRPLRVRLGEIDAFEVGHDLGGVQIEFFNLICKELFSQSAQMFSTNFETGYSYFTPGSLQPLYMFELAGLLFSLALYNGITLPVSLPIVFYRHLLDKPCREVSMIKDYWPTISRSLAGVLQGESEGIDMVFPLEANGLRLEVSSYDVDSVEPSRCTMHVLATTPIVHHEDQLPSKDATGETIRSQTLSTEGILADITDSWPGWRLMPSSKEASELTSENMASYVEDYISWLATDSVAPQLRAFKKGFHSCMDLRTIGSLFRPDTLRNLVEGSRILDLAELRRTTQYDGYESSSRYINSFWNIMASWPMGKQKQLVKFVTAAERIPAGGAGQLTFKITRSYPGSLDDLPRSSTCFGTLMLPRYSTPEILEEKLDLALKYGLEGFGAG